MGGVAAADTFLRGLDAPQECLRVANVKDEAAKRPLPGFADVYVGRTTALGNPFPMGERGRDETLPAGSIASATPSRRSSIETPPGTRAVDVAGPRRLQVGEKFKGAAEAQQRERALRELAEWMRAG